MTANFDCKLNMSKKMNIKHIKMTLEQKREKTRKYFLGEKFYTTHVCRVSSISPYYKIKTLFQGHHQY